jgi:Flp pilus assembly pilin Flp
MFDTSWTAVRCLIGRAQARIRAARAGDPESGALTLEWIIIAAAIALAAVGAVAFFATEVTKYTNKLP